MSFGKHNETFAGHEAFHLNACVGTNGGPYGLSDYACGYYDAAKRVIRSAAENGLHLDVLVYPVACMFRHAIELSIKHLLSRYPPLWSEPITAKLNHNLSVNWVAARGYVLRTGAFDEDQAPLLRVDRIVDNLIEIDPNGETFRYPTSRKGVHHLRDWKLINLGVLLDQIEFAEGFFDWCDCMADGIWEERSHALASWHP